MGDEHLSINASDLDQHSRDQSFHTPHRPAAVIWPVSTEQVSAILGYANRQHIPVTAWGAGTSLEGNPIPLYGGISLDMRRMHQILEIKPEDFLTEVQPGILYKDMNTALARHGLFFPPDPGANASVGGMIANNAAGTRTLRYGTTKDNVLRLEVVQASGEVIRTGTHATKTSSGYDLLHLFVGSEGTLGVITEATLKLAPLPEEFSAAIAAFPATRAATSAVAAIMGSGLIPAALEFMDPSTLRELNASGEYVLPGDPSLLMEFHSSTAKSLKHELAVVEKMCKQEGCTDFKAGLGREERDRLWQARHHVYEILLRSNPGKSFLIVDIAVPVSKYPELVELANQAMTNRNLKGYMVGHAGDGNLHPLIPYTPGDGDSYTVALEVDQVIVEAAIGLGGTATGEHGVGIGKRRFMESEHGRSLELMRSIKATLDPNGILNPGKIL